VWDATAEVLRFPLQTSFPLFGSPPDAPIFFSTVTCQGHDSLEISLTGPPLSFLLLFFSFFAILPPPRFGASEMMLLSAILGGWIPSPVSLSLTFPPSSDGPRGPLETNSSGPQPLTFPFLYPHFRTLPAECTSLWEHPIVVSSFSA